MHKFYEDSYLTEKRLLSERKYLYEISADYSVNTDKYGSREVAERIEKIISKI